MKSAIVLCSGGIDSVTTAYYVKKKLYYADILVLFFNYGQKPLPAEKKFSKKCAEKIGANFLEADLKWLGKISGSLINKFGKTEKINRKRIARLIYKTRSKTLEMEEKGIYSNRL